MNVVEFRGGCPAVGSPGDVARRSRTVCRQTTSSNSTGLPAFRYRSASLAWSVCGASGLRIVLRHLAGFVEAIEFVRHQILGGGWALPAPLSFPNLEARSVDLDIVPA